MTEKTELLGPAGLLGREEALHSGRGASGGGEHEQKPGEARSPVFPASQVDLSPATSQESERTCCG